MPTYTSFDQLGTGLRTDPLPAGATLRGLADALGDTRREQSVRIAEIRSGLFGPGRSKEREYRSARDVASRQLRRGGNAELEQLSRGARTRGLLPDYREAYRVGHGIVVTVKSVMMWVSRPENVRLQVIPPGRQQLVLTKEDLFGHTNLGEVIQEKWVDMYFADHSHGVVGIEGGGSIEFQDL